MSTNKRLHRSADDRILAGVCGGLAESFGVDATLLRLAAGLLFLATGFFPMGAIYLLLAMVMPVEPAFDALHEEDEDLLDAPVLIERERAEPQFTSDEVDAWGLRDAGVSAEPEAQAPRSRSAGGAS